MPEARERQWKNIGDRIREARTKLGLTQAQLGLQVGVSSQTVWAWESGRVKPTHEHLEELAFRCQVSTAWLLGRDVLEAELLKEGQRLLPRCRGGPAPGGRGDDPELHQLRPPGTAAQDGGRGMNRAQARGAACGASWG